MCALHSGLQQIVIMKHTKGRFWVKNNKMTGQISIETNNKILVMNEVFSL